MSKSDESPTGVISMFDSMEAITKKIMGATTDSDNTIKFDVDNKPGISNLINIVVSLTDKTIDDIEKEFEGIGYGEFKKYVASVVTEKIGAIQEKYNKLLSGNELDKILDEGMKKMQNPLHYCCWYKLEKPLQRAI